MFYPNDVLLDAKKGNFGIVWVAATVGTKNNFKRLTRNQIQNIDVPNLCQEIITPPQPMPLRLTSTLMTGVARVYAQQTVFYYNDVNQAYVKLRKSFLAGGGDETSINMQNPVARREAITLDISIDAMEDVPGVGPQGDLSRLLAAVRNPHDATNTDDLAWVIQDVDTPEKGLARHHAHTGMEFELGQDLSLSTAGGSRDPTRTPSMAFPQQDGQDGYDFFDGFDFVPDSASKPKSDFLANQDDFIPDAHFHMDTIPEIQDSPVEKKKRKKNQGGPKKPRKVKPAAIDPQTFVPYQSLFSHHQSRPLDGMDRSIIPATYFSNVLGHVPVSWFPIPHALPPTIAQGLIQGYDYGPTEKALREKFIHAIERQEVIDALSNFGLNSVVPEFQVLVWSGYVQDNQDRFTALFTKDGNVPQKGVKRKRSLPEPQEPQDVDFGFQDFDMDPMQGGVDPFPDSVEMARRISITSPAPWVNYIDKPHPPSESRSLEKKSDGSPMAWGDAPWSASGGSARFISREASVEGELFDQSSLVTDGPASVPFHLKDQVLLAQKQAMEKETLGFYDYMRDIVEKAGMPVTIFSDLVPSQTPREQAASAFGYVLSLATRNVIKVHQEVAYKDIEITLI